MGCLKKVINSIILALAIIGFFSIGGKDWVVNLWNNHMGKSPQTMLEKAQKVGDFSQINEEYENLQKESHSPLQQKE